MSSKAETEAHDPRFDDAESNGEMTASERNELLKLVKLRERVAKTAAAQRSAELLEEFEQQVASIYSFDDDEVWAKAMAAVHDAVDQVRAEIAERCRELGIPKRFAPDVHAQWYGRGENASRERRAELRKVATSRIAAIEKAAKTTIENRSLDIQARLIAGGLKSAEARAFLDSMPTIEALMPAPPTVAEIEGTTPRGYRSGGQLT